MKESDIDKLFKYMRGEFAKVHGSVDSLGSRVDRLQSDINAMGRQITELQDGQTELRNGQTELSRRMGTIDLKLDAIQDAVGENFVDYDKRFDRHASWITQLASATETNLRPRP
ncbi:hypothetical protein EF294_03715 [Gordonia oryzae]|uniref:t-SNARE coiled-coil homology domain-containing protein n=1 Tax=Gordonia oryzae TaxID=2487349 RepID=A0A3N4GYR3_9ACTN|nr:hypothetical protein [Gordonia oryzae]RPA65856.1 hypothetical protein EF294_03715 [Gordonia oryzae]